MRCFLPLSSCNAMSTTEKWKDTPDNNDVAHWSHHFVLAWCVPSFFSGFVSSTQRITTWTNSNQPNLSLSFSVSGYVSYSLFCNTEHLFHNTIIRDLVFPLLHRVSRPRWPYAINRSVNTHLLLHIYAFINISMHLLPSEAVAQKQWIKVGWLTLVCG